MTDVLAPLTPLLVPLDSLHPSPANPRLGVIPAIADSLKANGQYRPIVARLDGEILAGNHTWKAASSLGWTHIAAVQLDVTDEQARRIMLADNRTADLGSYDDDLLLALLQEVEQADATLAGTGFTPDDLAVLAGLVSEEQLANPYTRKAAPIQYEPTQEEPPPCESLVDRTKTDGLLAQIQAADLPPEVRSFLVAGAMRHLVFDYAAIAEFYAHAEPDVQQLMEASALVILDLDDAIAHGFVKLSARLSQLLELDLEEQASLRA